MELPYTICFCRSGDKILMLYRNRPPNQHRWNGLGGKIRVDETPLACVQREVMEEAGIDLHKVQRLRFAGIVTWLLGADSTSSSKGMYAFVADLPSEELTWTGDRVTPEGLLCWKPIEWVCDSQNIAVVENIPRFLPSMLAQPFAQEYYCDYRGKHLKEVVVRVLSRHVIF